METRTIQVQPKEHPHAWLWLVGAGSIAVVLVLFGPQMFGAAKTPPVEPPAPDIVTPDVDDSTPPEPPKPIDLSVPQAVENVGDPLVLAGRADLALSEGRPAKPQVRRRRDRQRQGQGAAVHPLAGDLEAVGDRPRRGRLAIAEVHAEQGKSDDSLGEVQRNIAAYADAIPDHLRQ